MSISIGEVVQSRLRPDDWRPPYLLVVYGVCNIAFRESYWPFKFDATFGCRCIWYSFVCDMMILFDLTPLSSFVFTIPFVSNYIFFIVAECTFDISKKQVSTVQFLPILLSKKKWKSGYLHILS